MTKHKHKKKDSFQNWLIPGMVIALLLTGIVLLVKVFLAPDSVHRKDLYSVTLLKPPPPPEQKEKPPEPEPPKEQPKENIIAPNEAQQQQDQNDDSPPPGADLGVDADASGAGGDSFGLLAKKGGRAITLGGGGAGGGVNRLSLLTKYGWYTSKLQDEIKQQMRKRLDKNGGVPKGKYQATVHIVLDPQGEVLNYRIVASSGNDKIDEAIKLSLPGMRVSQPPPEGMPRSMTVRVSSQG
ncbi:MAG: TonB family protein [Oryzomonas sp.]|jgi:TonB family protein